MKRGLRFPPLTPVQNRQKAPVAPPPTHPPTHPPNFRTQNTTTKNTEHKTKTHRACSLFYLALPNKPTQSGDSGRVARCSFEPTQCIPCQFDSVSLHIVESYFLVDEATKHKKYKSTRKHKKTLSEKQTKMRKGMILSQTAKKHTVHTATTPYRWTTHATPEEACDGIGVGLPASF